MDRGNYDVLSNFSAIHNIDINNTINDFESLLKEISSITKTRKQMKYDLADFPMMAVLFKTIPYKKHLTISTGSYFNEKNDIFISNLIEELKTTIEKEVLKSEVAIV